MSKAFQLATMPELASDAISGRNMIINGSFQRCYRQRRNSPDITSGGNNYITDRWKVNAYGTDPVNFIAQADATGDDGIAYNISEDGQQYAYLGYKTVSAIPNNHYLALFQTIEQTLVSQLKWGKWGHEQKPAVLSFRAMFIPGQNDTRETHKISVAIRTISTGTPGTQDLNQRSIVFDCTLTKVADRYEIRIPPLLDGGYDIASQSSRGALDIIFTVSSKSTNVVDAVPANQVGQWVHSGRFISPNAESLGEASRVGSKVLISDVQFEAGEVATRYNYEDYDTLCTKCARYYYTLSGRNYAWLGIGVFETPTILQMMADLGNMRAAPTYSYFGTFAGESSGGNLTPAGFGLLSTRYARVQFNAAAAGTVSSATAVRALGTGSGLVFDADL